MNAKECDRESRRDTWFENRLVLGSVHKYLGGGLGKMEGAKKVLSYRKGGGGPKKFLSVVKGGSKKFGQIESIMKIKMHTLLLKILTGYSLRLDLYFKIFPGPLIPPLAQPQEHLAFV